MSITRRSAFRSSAGCGYRVGLVAQPDWRDPEALKVMGRPRIGVGVTSGNMDSMVNIYTVGRRFRKDDCFSENGETGRRPPHALIVYAQLVRQAFPGIRIQLGGLEASFRRIAHYDYWQDKIRPSVLLDSKADILVYGMGERPTPEVFRRFAADEPLDGIRGTARLLGKKAAEAFDPGDRYLFLPSYEETLADRDALMTATIMVEQEMNFQSGRGLLQRYGDRLLVVEPPPEPLKPEELDRVHELPYARRPHPKYKGRIPAYETIKDSIQAVRGCPGGCAFCGLVVHQGRHVMSRSEDSIMRELDTIAEQPFFKGTISDVGGAAGNIYESRYDLERCRKCRRSSCLFPVPCSSYVCTGKEMKTVDDFLDRHKWSLQQVQDYIPLPMTMGGAMYYTGKAPDGTPIRVNRGLAERRQQIGVLKKRRSGNAKNSDPARRCWEKGKKR